MIQKLYMLKPYREPWYEEVEAVIIRARSSAKARQIAQRGLTPSRSDTEVDWLNLGTEVDWLNPRDVKLRKLGEASPGTRQAEEIVLVARASA